MKQEKITISTVIIALIFTLIMIPASSAEGPKKVAILPFTMNADRDLTFLQKGIMDMLASRLSWKDKVEPMEDRKVRKKAEEFGRTINRGTALEIGKALKADYVIMGSLTIFGDSVSIDAKILDVTKGAELVTAFNQSKGMDEVIPTVNQFAKDINDKILGRYVRPQEYAMGPQTDRGRGGLVKVKDRLEGGDVAHAQRFKTAIVSLDTGDVDGDGKEEIVFIDSDTVYVYRWTENAFALITTFTGWMSSNFVYVSVADLDGNGKAEIYVSNLTKDYVSSFVLEMRGAKLATILKRQKWLFRVVDLPGRGKTLIGQSRIAGGGFRRYIYTFDRKGGAFSRGEALNLPTAKANVFNFVQGHIIKSDKVHTLVLYPDTEYLFLFDQDGEEIWESDEPFGGIDTHLVVPGIQAGDEKWIHFSPPIFISDVDADGQNEVVISKSKSSVRRLVEKFRHFESGRVHFLSWDRAGLSTKFQTKKVSGTITGYSLCDIDHDGNKELVVGLTAKPKSIIGKSARGQVIVYDLQ